MAERAQRKEIAKSERKNALNRLPPALLALTVSSFAIGTTEFTPIGLLPNIASDLSISISHAGLLISGYALGVTFSAPVLTATLARVPRKSLLIGLMALFSVMNLCAAIVPTFELLLITRFVTAFAHGVFYAVGATVAAELVSPQRQASAISVMFAGITVAMAFSVPLATLIGQRFGWRVTFVGIALLGIVAVGAILSMVPATTQIRPPLSASRQFLILRHKRLLFVLAITTIGWAGAFVPFTYLAAILEEVTRIQPTIVSLLLILFGVAVAIGNLLGGKAADQGIHRSLSIIFALQIVVLLIFGLVVKSQFYAILIVMALGLLQLSTGPGLQLLVVRLGQRLDPGSEDVCSGLNQASFNLGIALGAFVGGRVVDSPLGLTATPWAGAFLVLCALLLTRWSWRINRSESW